MINKLMMVVVLDDEIIDIILGRGEIDGYW
jgi:hypothetical protein